jgi:hypothetical protein
MALPHVIRSHEHHIVPTMTALVNRKYLGHLTEENLLDGQVVRSHFKKGEERGEEKGVLKHNPLGVNDPRKVEIPKNLMRDRSRVPATRPLFGMTNVASFSDNATRQQGIHLDHRACPSPRLMKHDTPTAHSRHLTYGMVGIKTM